jgi:hypothetical protein
MLLRSSDVARESEVLGKFKEHDWFVNPTTGATMGVSLTLGDPEGGTMLDQTVIFRMPRCKMDRFRKGLQHSRAASVPAISTRS